MTNAIDFVFEANLKNVHPAADIASQSHFNSIKTQSHTMSIAAHRANTIKR